MWKYFCDQTCLMGFIQEHVEEFARLHPRREPLETPIEDPKKVDYGYRTYTQIYKRVDNE